MLQEKVFTTKMFSKLTVPHYMAIKSVRSSCRHLFCICHQREHNSETPVRGMWTDICSAHGLTSL